MMAVTVIAGDDECPFPHDKNPVKPRDNVFPSKDGEESNAPKLAKTMTIIS